MVHRILLCVKLRKAGKLTGNFIVIIHLIEFEVGTRFEKFGHTLRLFHSREFQQNLAHLVLKLLDVGSHHAELVDTGAENIERGIHLALHLLPEGFCHLAVAGRALQLSEEFTLAGEKAGHHAGLDIGGYPVDIVSFTRLGAFSLRFLHRGVDLVKLCVARRILTENIGHRDLEDHVHSPLEVQTETHLHLADLIIGIAQIYLFLVDRIVELFQTLFVNVIRLIGGFRHLGGILLGLVLVVTRHERK